MLFLKFMLALASLASVSAKFLLVPRENLPSNFMKTMLVSHFQLNTIFDNAGFQVYTAETLPNEESDEMKTLSESFYVEPEQVYSVNFNTDMCPANNLRENKQSTPWHLDRIGKQHLPLNNSYPYTSPGSCHKNSNVEIETVVVDTGCDPKHPEFEGRTEFLKNFSGDNIDFDGNSHGSHCSGIIGAKSFGVCRDAKIKCVKVLDSQGSGSTSGVISGMEYTFKRHLEKEKSNPKLRTIMSMSLGGGYSWTMNNVIEKMLDSSNTFYVVVASGNSNEEACRSSPASSRGVMTVNAMNKYDERAYFSNFGTCSHVYSPGVNIESTIPNGKTAIYSGTSMACPAVAGVMNHVLDMFPHLNMKQLKEKIMEDATKNTISGNPKDTPNLMVYLKRL